MMESRVRECETSGLAIATSGLALKGDSLGTQIDVSGSPPCISDRSANSATFVGVPVCLVIPAGAGKPKSEDPFYLLE
jgi:hypothetical protein